MLNECTIELEPVLLPPPIEADSDETDHPAYFPEPIDIGKNCFCFFAIISKVKFQILVAPPPPEFSDSQHQPRVQPQRMPAAP